SVGPAGLGAMHSGVTRRSPIRFRSLPASPARTVVPARGIHCLRDCRVAEFRTPVAALTVFAGDPLTADAAGKQTDCRRLRVTERERITAIRRLPKGGAHGNHRN